MRFYLPFICLPLAACTTQPLPDNVSRKSTFDIVQSIRCEAAVGVADMQRKGLLQDPDLDNTYIGFDFRFDIYETNKAAGGKLTFTEMVSGGTFGLDLTGSAEKTRKNERFFRVINTFRELLTPGQCAEERANFLYPITGYVGVDEIVGTYGKLKAFTLGAASDKQPTIFSDTITFTTKFAAGLKPTLNITTVTGKLELKNATIDGSVERNDIHKVVVAIAPKVFNPGAYAFMAITSERSAAQSLATPGAAGSTAAVVLELNRIRSRDDDVRVLDEFRLLQ